MAPRFFHHFLIFVSLFFGTTEVASGALLESGEAFTGAEGDYNLPTSSGEFMHHAPQISPTRDLVFFLARPPTKLICGVYL